MASKMKYVMFENNDFILIPLNMRHVDIKLGALKPKSAGFVRFFEEENQWGEKITTVDCFGESTTLKLASDPEYDTKRINSAMRLN